MWGPLHSQENDYFNGYGEELQSEVGIGTTIDPIYGLHFPGQSGPQNGLVVRHYGPDPELMSAVSHINDGSPDKTAINIFNELLGDPRHLGGATPRFWESIGSRIKFSTLTGDYTRPTIFAQPYPTYYVYVNGVLNSVWPQAPDPSYHFYAHTGDPLKGSYPFGTKPSSGTGGTIPGGRNGDAASAVEPSSRVPPRQVYYPFN